MKVALDTDVLACAEGTNGAAMRDKALDPIHRLPAGIVVLPVQTLGELFNVLVRTAKRRLARARTVMLSWRDAYPTVETSAAVKVNATDLASVACFCPRIFRKDLRGVVSP
jgi:predicted nucleic acid-binding protein